MDYSLLSHFSILDIYFSPNFQGSETLSSTAANEPPQKRAAASHSFPSRERSSTHSTSTTHKAGPRSSPGLRSNSSWPPTLHPIPRGRKLAIRIMSRLYYTLDQKYYISTPASGKTVWAAHLSTGHLGNTPKSSSLGLLLGNRNTSGTPASLEWQVLGGDQMT